MKHCGKCQTDKPLDEFHRRGKGRQPYCKTCKKEDDAQYRRENMDYFVARAKRQKTGLRNWYNNLKSGPCTDCHQRFDPVIMQWDHLPGFEKNRSVSTLVRTGNRQVVLDEIAKCELVCANCHALRTRDRRAIT